MTTSRRAPRPNFHRQLAWKSKWPPIHWARTSALPTGLLSCDKNSQLPNQSSAGNPTRHRFGIPAGSEAERWLSKVLTADIPGSHNAKSQLYPSAFPDGAGPRTVKLKLRTAALKISHQPRELVQALNMANVAVPMACNACDSPTKSVSLCQLMLS